MKNKYDKETLLCFYREMFRIRSFEIKAGELFRQALLFGNIHTCVGQEATIAGACQALAKTDFITSTHRGHGHCIGKGARVDRMMAELFGKATGFCRGKGGSMHIADVSIGILGSNGVVGAGIPIATGSALTSKIRKTGEVTLAFFGDGASNQGTFHESLNMASAWKLPIIFLCENNKYGVSVRIESVINVENIADRARGYNIPGMVVDGNDIIAVYEAVKSAAERARSGQGPTLVECKTYRLHGHFEGDPMEYRSKIEMQEWRAKDPVLRLKNHILQENIASDEEISLVENEIAAEILAAVEFAKDSPYPNADDLAADVYASDNERSVLY